MNEHEAQLLNTLETVTKQMAVAVTRCSRDFRYLWANQAYGDWIQHPLNEIVGHPILEVLGKDAFEALLPHFNRALTGETVRYEQETNFRGIGPRWISAVYTPTLDVDGAADGWVAVVVDITERKRTEESARLFRALLDQSNDALEVLDPETLRFLDVNEKACDDLGYSRQELLGLGISDIDPFVDESLRAKVRDDLSRLGFAVMETRHRRKDGSVFPVEVSIKRVVLDRPYVVTVARDITQRKRVEDAIRESEWRYRRIVETTSEGVWLLDAKLHTSYVNRQMAEMLGYEPGDMVGRNVFDFYFSEDVDHKRQVLTRRQQGLQEQLEERLQRKDGSELWVRMAATPVVGEHGEFDGAFAMVCNITERRRAEQALRESEERLRLAAQAARMFAYSWDAATDVIERSGESAEILGVEAASVATGAAVSAMVHPSDRERLETAMAKLTVETPQLEVTYRIIRPDGGVIWLDRNSRAYFDKHGKIKRLIGMVVDITEHKRAEEAIRESEQRFRLVADHSPVMIWMSGLDKRPTYFNRLWLDFTGKSETDLLQNGLESIVHPEDYPKCHDIYCRGFDSRQPFTKECRLRRPDGQYRWMLDIGVPRFHEDGSFAGYIGSCVDITEQKLAEEALSSMSRRLIEAQEQERTRIARELHDDISQRLALVAMSLDRQGRDLHSTARGMRSVMRKATKQISDVVSDVHMISHRLHSSKLDIVGLAAASASFCREFSKQQDLAIDFQCDGIPKQLPEAVALCMFRVLQEALQNAAKHSGAKQFRVSLAECTNQIALTITDEGRGFNPAEVLKGSGLGLASMMERLKLVGGELLIDASPKGGTTIRASVPFVGQSKSASTHG